MTSAEEVFRPAFEEISRRATAAREFATDETTYFARGTSDLCHLPFVLADQSVALVSMGTSVLAPRPVEQQRPALRIYGAFADAQEAKEHADVVQSLDPTCSLAVVPLREWFLMPQTEECRDDPELRLRRTRARLQEVRASRMEDGERFEKRVRERTDGTSGGGGDAEDPDEAAELAEAEALVYKAPRRLRAGGEVRGQTMVAVCVIPDALRGECLVHILGCLENADIAERWVRDVASRHMTDDDIHVAPTCEWIYPNGEPATGGAKYRNDELQRIMDAAERNPVAVRDYKTWKAEQDAKRANEEEENGEKNGEAMDVS